MTSEQVKRRLDKLRELYVPETIGEARARFKQERLQIEAETPFPVLVQRRLDRLRALDDAMRVLRGAAKRTARAR